MKFAGKYLIALVCAIAVFVAAGFAGATEDGNARPSYMVIQFDNDIFSGSDRDYTSGARIAYLRPIAEGRLSRTQKWLQALAGAGRPKVFGRLTTFTQPEDLQYDWGIGITQLMFTPDDPDAPAAPPGERPYAGWLGFEFSLHAKDAAALSSATFSIGLTGRYAVAEHAQEWIHKNFTSSPIYKGWDSQVPTEVTLNLHVDRKHRLAALAEATAAWPLQLDGYAGWGAALGSFRTDAYLGFLMRIGWNLPIEYTTPRLQLGSYSHQYFSGNTAMKSNWSGYVFIGARATAVAHDVTLDGPLFRSHSGTVSSRPLVGEVLPGVGVRYRRAALTFSWTIRSDEFRGQRENHQFGSLMLSLRF